MFSLVFFLLVPLLSALNLTAPPQVRSVHRRGAPTPPPSYLRLPVFVNSKQPLVEKERFSPARGSGLEPLPDAVRGVLLPVQAPVQPEPGPPGESPDSVQIWCKVTRMLVQVERSVLGAGDPVSWLRLGTCGASEYTWDHVYFDYDLDACGTERAMVDNMVTYSNTLRYDPPGLQAPIRRAVPFTLPVSCRFPRYQYSYKVGYTPQVQMRDIYKQMTKRAKFILTPRNAQWKRLSPSDQYVLGQPIYFEAEAPPMPPNQRLYILSCYATAEKSHASTPQFPIVANLGCMVESKAGRSRFIPYRNNVVRFFVDAFMFMGKSSQLFMHCSMSVASSIPTTTTKSCNYEPEAGRWVELYGSDSVCSCCDSSCISTASTVTKIISSRPWTVKPKGRPNSTLKRRKASTTSSSTTTTPQPEATEWTPETESTAPMNKMEKTQKELEEGEEEE
ncbi:zona pellucida sperm-binding protein 3d.2, partial [Mugil cephalus]|uniref:zona pellucida sperm-binding protein 3d.2 n=1 Tax=Mugil cephalus TaxID=48193 RepID=UPI001FB686F5